MNVSSHINVCPFYALQGLSSVLAKALNLPKVSAVCIFVDDASKNILLEAANVLRPIGLTEQLKNATFPTFAMPAVYVSKGKGGGGRKKKNNRQ